MVAVISADFSSSRGFPAAGSAYFSPGVRERILCAPHTFSPRSVRGERRKEEKKRTESERERERERES